VEDIMETYRNIMEKDGGNLSWCKPVRFTRGGATVIVAQNEGAIVGLDVNGQDVTLGNDNLIKSVADALELNVDKLSDLYDYSWEGLDIDELSCRQCPWFKTCEAMDAAYGG